MSDSLKRWLPSVIVAILAVALPALSDSARAALLAFIASNPEWSGVIVTVATALANIVRSPLQPSS